MLCDDLISVYIVKGLLHLVIQPIWGYIFKSKCKIDRWQIIKNFYNQVSLNAWNFWQTSRKKYEHVGIVKMGQTDASCHHKVYLWLWQSCMFPANRILVTLQNFSLKKSEMCPSFLKCLLINTEERQESWNLIPDSFHSVLG